MPTLSRRPATQPPPLDAPAAGMRGIAGAQVAAHSVVDGHLPVGYCGAPGSPALGPMTGDLRQASARLRELIGTYPRDRPVVPVVELIATTVNPGGSPRTSTRVSSSSSRRTRRTGRR